MLVATLTVVGIPWKANAASEEVNIDKQTEQIKSLLKEKLKKESPGHEKEVNNVVNGEIEKIKNIFKMTNERFDSSKDWPEEQWDWMRSEREKEIENESRKWKQEDEDRNRQHQQEDAAFKTKLLEALTNPYFLIPAVIVLVGTAVVAGVSLICHIPIVNN